MIVGAVLIEPLNSKHYCTNMLLQVMLAKKSQKRNPPPSVRIEPLSYIPACQNRVPGSGGSWPLVILYGGARRPAAFCRGSPVPPAANLAVAAAIDNAYQSPTGENRPAPPHRRGNPPSPSRDRPRDQAKVVYNTVRQFQTIGLSVYCGLGRMEGDGLLSAWEFEPQREHYKHTTDA